MRGQCWWKGGPENELEFTMGAVKLGPFKIGKDKNEVKSYKFFVNDGKVGFWGDDTLSWGSGYFRRTIPLSRGEMTPHIHVRETNVEFFACVTRGV